MGYSVFFCVQFTGPQSPAKTLRTLYPTNKSGHKCLRNQSRQKGPVKKGPVKMFKKMILDANDC